MIRVIIFLNLIFTSHNFLSAQVQAYIPSDSLKGWWPFNGNANDESGNGNDGSVNGATISSDRYNISNKAYFFDGLNDFIEVVHSNTLNFNTSPFSISAWVRPVQYGSVEQNILSKERRFAPDGYQLRMALEGSSTPTNKHLYFAMGALGNGTNWTPSTGHALSSTGNVVLNSWTHIVAVREGAVFKLYVNDTLAAFDTTLIGTAVDHTNNFNNVTIGAVIDTSSPGNRFAFFNGKIDDIAIWKKALSQQEVHDVYCGPRTDTINAETCSSYLSPSGKYSWFQSGTYFDTLLNVMGCDSIITINLTVSDIDTGLYHDTLFEILYSKELNADFYQWLDCFQQMAFIVGKTDRGITLMRDQWESYAVAITKGNCADTSACKTFRWEGIHQNKGLNTFNIYPNPANDVLSIWPRERAFEQSYEIQSILGRTVMTGTIENTDGHLNISTLIPGMYIFRLRDYSILFIKS